MNRIVTSREEILEKSRQLLREQGAAAVNIRSVAAACGVSVGSIYNYFSSKAELTAAVVESVWLEIFRPAAPGTGFSDCVRGLFSGLEEGSRQYPGFLRLHAAVFSDAEKPDGTPHMARLLAVLRQDLLRVLEQDSHVRPDAFDLAFSREQLVEVVFSAAVAAMAAGQFDCSALLALLDRLLYRP